MKGERFESLVPEFFCALGRLYEVRPEFFWSELCGIAECMVKIERYLTTLKGLGFEYGLDELVSPWLEGFINSMNNPEGEEIFGIEPQVLAFNSLCLRLHQVKLCLKDELERRIQELKNRTDLRPEEPV
jgi:hypothetical protein